MLSPLRLREDNIIESPLDFIELIKKAWGNYNKPLCKLFKTNTSGYLYDTGTNKLLKCSKKEYQFIDILFSCSFADAIDRLNQIYPKQEMLNIMNEIGKKMEQEKILLVTNASFGQGAHFHNYEAQMRDHLSNILLEVTERCNLRCIYCIYNNKYQGKRDHGLRDMSTNIAYRAIDFLAEHSKNCDEVAITFYGGEPLLNFSLIKSCVGYAQKRIKKNIFHSITTNGIFLDHEKADFFYKNGFSVVVSLDGNKITHDEWRKNIQGTGSFDETLRGLRTLYESFRNEQHRISLSMVYTPPFSENRVSNYSSLWTDNEWIPKNIGVNITYPSMGSIEKRHYPEHGDEDSLKKWARESFVRSYQLGSEVHPFARAVIEKKMARLWKRTVYDEPLKSFFLNACCIPGVRKIYVTVEGGFQICERVQKSPSLGDVYEGINIDKIKDIFIDGYANSSRASCEKCWCAALCGICYIHAYRDYRFDSCMKANLCEYERQSILKDLILFCSLIEHNEGGLSYLDSWEVK